MIDRARRAHVSWHFPALLLALLLVIYLITFPGAIGPRTSDDRSLYLVTQALVDRHDAAIQAPPSQIAIAPGWQPVPTPTTPCATEPGSNGIAERPGGPAFSKYGIGQSLAAAPLYLVGEAMAGRSQPSYRAEVSAFVTAAYNPIVTALTATLLCLLALRLGWSPRVALGLSLLFGLATPAWAYTATFFSEPSIGLCLLGALTALLWSEDAPSERAALLCGLCLAAAMLIRLDSALYVPAFGLFLLARTARQSWPTLLAALIGPLALAFALIGWYNVARFGSVLTTGYGIAGDSHDLHPPRGPHALWDGVYGLLLSPGKGLFIYAPILLLLPFGLLRLRDERRGASWLILGIAAIAVAIHANTLIVWLGGWAWGPRFLIPIVPLLLLPIGALLQSSTGAVRLAWLLGIVGILIQLPSVVVDKSIYITYVRDHDAGRCIWRAEDLYKWHPQYSPLIGQWQRMFAAETYTNATAAVTARFRTPASVGAGGFTPEPHTWWGLLIEQGAPPLFIISLALILCVIAAYLVRYVLRLAGPPAREPELPVQPSPWQRPPPPPPPAPPRVIVRR